MDRNEIEKAIKDIHYIKEVISRNIAFLNKFVRSKGIRILSLIFGIFILLSFIILYYLIRNQILEEGSIYVKIVIAFVLLVITIIAGIIKLKIWNNLYPDKPLPVALFKIISGQILKIILTIIIIMVSFAFILILFKYYYYLVLVFGIGFGLIYVLYGIFFYLGEVEITGYWFLITTLLSFIFIIMNPINTYLFFAIIFGIGFMITFVVSIIIDRLESYRK